MNTQNYRSFKWCSKATLPLQIWIQGEISLPAHSQSKIIISMNTFLEKKNQDYKAEDLMKGRVLLEQCGQKEPYPS